MLTTSDFLAQRGHQLVGFEWDPAMETHVDCVQRDTIINCVRDGIISDKVQRHLCTLYDDELISIIQKLNPWMEKSAKVCPLVFKGRVTVLVTNE